MECLHESQYLEPVMRDIEAMLQESQRNVNGTVILELRPLSFSTVGVDSKDDLVKTKFGEYGEMQRLTAEDAKVSSRSLPLHCVFITTTIRTKKYDQSRDYWRCRIYGRRIDPLAAESSDAEITRTVRAMPATRSRTCIADCMVKQI